MSVKYVLTERGNPLKPEDPKKWYAHAKSAGEITLKQLSEDIAQRSTVNYADTLAVLEALTQVLSMRLSEGLIVRFSDFGSFQISVGSKGAETADKFTSSLITSKKVIFRPGVDIKTMLNNLTFQKIS